MDFNSEINRVDEAIETIEAEVLRANIKLAGLKAERGALLAAMEQAAPTPGPVQDEPVAEMPNLSLLARTDALTTVLEITGRTMTILEVREALESGGRTHDPYGNVVATLRHLVQEGRVLSPSRGRYAAA